MRIAITLAKRPSQLMNFSLVKECAECECGLVMNKFLLSDRYRLKSVNIWQNFKLNRKRLQLVNGFTLTPLSLMSTGCQMAASRPIY